MVPYDLVGALGCSAGLFRGSDWSRIAPKDAAISLNADTQAQGVALVLTGLLCCLSHFSAAPPFLVHLLLSNTSFNREFKKLIFPVASDYFWFL